jgi:hypothetical protein
MASNSTIKTEGLLYHFLQRELWYDDVGASSKVVASRYAPGLHVVDPSVRTVLAQRLRALSESLIS